MEFEPMSRDEIERTMQFILHQQAQFAANMERTEVDLAKLAAQQGRLEAHQERFEANLERLGVKTDNIADGLIGLTGVVGQLTDSVSRLVNTFERHLRDHHGHTPS